MILNKNRSVNKKMWNDLLSEFYLFDRYFDCKLV